MVSDCKDIVSFLDSSSFVFLFPHPGRNSGRADGFMTVGVGPPSAGNTTRYGYPLPTPHTPHPTSPALLSARPAVACGLLLVLLSAAQLLSLLQQHR